MGVYVCLSHVGSGVPQCSVFGPVLFFIYINDLHKRFSCRIRKYADDTNIQFSLCKRNETSMSSNET